SAKDASGTPQVDVLLQEKYAIQSTQGFKYTVGKDGEFGNLISSGAGKLTGKIGDEKKPQNIFMSWNGLSIEPNPVTAGQIVFKLAGGVKIDLEGFGSMTSQKFELWCNQEKSVTDATSSGIKPLNLASNAVPTPRLAENSAQNTSSSGVKAGKSNPFGGGNTTLVPDRAVALEKVHFMNEKGTCDVNRLDMFFETVKEDGSTAQSKWLPSILTTLPPSLKVAMPSPVFPLPLNFTGNSATQLASIRNAAIPHNPIQQVQYQQQLPLVSTNRNGIAAIPANTSVNSPTFPASPTAPLLPLVASNQNASLPPNRGGNATTGVQVNPRGLPAPPANSSKISNQPPPSTANPHPPHQKNSVASQNLLGFQSGQNGGKFAITGNQMKMLIRMANGTSQVDQVVLEGKVHIIEQVTGLDKKSTSGTPESELEILGEEVTVWNPSTVKTVILAAGTPQNEAIFKGRGVELRTQNLKIYRENNTIWSSGVGRFMTTSNQNVPNFFATNTTTSAERNTPQNSTSTTNEFASVSSDSQFVVDWNETMLFDGKTILLEGIPDKNGGRVKARFQDQLLVCDVMQIHLNRTLQLFDDSSSVQPEAEIIDCVGNVYVERREKEGNVMRSYDRARFANFRLLLKTQDFYAGGPGELRSTFLKSETNSPGTMFGGIVPTNSASSNPSASELSYIFVSFHKNMEGNFFGEHKFADLKGSVQAVYCPVNSWDDEIGMDRLSAAINAGGFLLICDALRVSQMPDPETITQNSAELTASGDASIEGKTFFGQGRTIKYNQAKNLVGFDGNANITTSEKGNNSRIPAESFIYNLKTGAIESVRSQGFSYGN
ncbi:MAG: LptA/OstA family protein, partial [Thermoguttaceae bacterium]